jgi:hypothetical protein
MRIKWKPQNVTPLLSEERMRFWGGDAEVSLRIHRSLRFRFEPFIEKYFACLGRSDAENDDALPNQNAGALCISLLNAAKV